MQYWWVNQNQTFKQEVEGGFLWSPKKIQGARKNRFYDNMTEVQVGDVIFSYCDTCIKAVGIAQGTAISSVKPHVFGAVGQEWDQDGWYVPVAFDKLKNQIRPKDHIDKLVDALVYDYAPLQLNGNGKQVVYLAEVQTELANRLITLIGHEFYNVIQRVRNTDIAISNMDDNKIEQDIKGRVDIGETTKEYLILARRGQGVFKSNVSVNEKCCRVTKISDLKHLIASHIKPWKASNDEEKLNGCNGLLLAPHIDHLFDKGYISFTAEGDLLTSPLLDNQILKAWGIQYPLNVGNFNPEQAHFLQYHREYILKK